MQLIGEEKKEEPRCPLCHRSLTNEAITHIKEELQKALAEREFGCYA